MRGLGVDYSKKGEKERSIEPRWEPNFPHAQRGGIEEEIRQSAGGESGGTPCLLRTKRRKKQVYFLWEEDSPKRGKVGTSLASVAHEPS